MEKKRTIGNVTAGLMVVTALLFDGVQALLTMSVFLIPFALFFTILSTIIFGLWFLLLGAYSGKGAEKRLAMTALATIVEFIPLINALPAVTASVVVNIMLSRGADVRARAGKPTIRNAAAAQRLERMRASSARRQQAARQGREEAQQARHQAANDNGAEGISEVA